MEMDKLKIKAKELVTTITRFDIIIKEMVTLNNTKIKI